MRLVVGLGNPGEQYQQTRHNVGFMTVDALVENKSWSQSKNGLLSYAWLNQNDRKIEVVKPQTFMNRSGQAVKYAVNGHPDLKLNNLWVIHDDLDLKLGNFKIQLGVGPKKHHGLLSIYESLGTKGFWHVRVGVDNRANPHISGEDYVLGKFLPAEKEILKQTLDQVITAIKQKL